MELTVEKHASDIRWDRCAAAAQMATLGRPIPAGAVYWCGLATLAALVMYLNWYATGMQGLLPHYTDYRRIILHGFDPAMAIHGTPTFPMWGYGWLMLLTQNRLALLLLQNLGAMVAAVVLLRAVRNAKAPLQPSPWTAPAILGACALPWLAAHSLEGPYSVAASLWVIAIVLLAKASGSGAGLRWYALAGLFAGLALNFRSDWVLAPVVFAAVVLWSQRLSRHGAIGALVWVGSVAAVLAPWALYTRHVTGHALLTSTNGGHVLFIGLGDLPGNRWGIIPHDGDPQMRRAVERELGAGAPSTTYRANQILMPLFLRTVAADPGEYGRKLIHSAREIVLGGSYSGEFCNVPGNTTGCRAVFSALLANTQPSQAPAGTDRSPGLIRMLLAALSVASTRVLVLLSFAVLPVTAITAWRSRDCLPALIAVAIVYQFLLQTLAANLHLYTNNALLLHMVNLAFGWTAVRRWFEMRRQGAQGA
jgi:hypothetical protein